MYAMQEKLLPPESSSARRSRSSTPRSTARRRGCSAPPRSASRCRRAAAPPSPAVPRRPRPRRGRCSGGAPKPPTRTASPSTSSAPSYARGRAACTLGTRLEHYMAPRTRAQPRSSLRRSPLQLRARQVPRLRQLERGSLTATLRPASHHSAPPACRCHGYKHKTHPPVKRSGRTASFGSQARAHHPATPTSPTSHTASFGSQSSMELYQFNDVELDEPVDVAVRHLRRRLEHTGSDAQRSPSPAPHHPPLLSRCRCMRRRSARTRCSAR